MPFIEARTKGRVNRQEARAVEMLRTVCDKERFLIYLQYGELPARGNLTGHMYLVRRFERVAEIINGKVACEWCIHINKAEYPETDNVVAMKSLIEGEEQEFRKIANQFMDPNTWNSELPPIPHVQEI